jgi:hypothetical protein
MRRIKLREGQHFSFAPHLKLVVVGVSDDQVELELVEDATQPGLPRNARVGRDAPPQRDARTVDESESRFYVEFA